MDLNEKVNTIVKELNVKESLRLKADGFSNACFFDDEGNLTDQYKVTSKEKKKYINIDFGGSGAFVVDKTDNQVYNIKGYGVVNKKKCYGSIFDLDGGKLHGLRYDYRNVGKRK